MNRRRATLRFCAALLGLLAPAGLAAGEARADVVFADFEGTDFAGWQAEGDAFAAGPSRGANGGQRPVTGFVGRGLVNSYTAAQRDKATGRLRSPEFVIDRHFIAFRIGGGGWPQKTCLNLLVDGRVVRTAVGPNTQKGGHEELQADGWNVAEFAGRRAQLEIVDSATSGWGHVTVDHIVFTDAPAGLREVVRTWPVDGRWLWVPVQPGAALRRIELRVDGELVNTFDAELAAGEPAWFAPLDLGPWRGRTLELRAEALPTALAALPGFQLRDERPDTAQLYREPLRPQVHFTPRRGYINDPNGLVFYRGEYNLFFQHNPVGVRSANKHWGHAVSRDLIHWTELGEALRPDAMGMMYSGSAVVDWHNTSGFGRDGEPPLVLIYTAANAPRVQCLAYSTDGRTFTKFAGNPVLPNVTSLNRDPKVFWHEPTARWVMALYVSPPEKTAAGEEVPRHTVQFYTSPNLRDWTLASEFAGGLGPDRFLYECPDIFPLPVPGRPGERKWVLWGANGEYALGAFDGTAFHAEAVKLPAFFGRAYAGQTFNDEPSGRVVQIHFVRAPAPGMPFMQCLSVPLELSLRETPAGWRVASWPVPEFAQLRGAAFALPARTLAAGEKTTLTAADAPLDIELTLRPGPDARVTLDVLGCAITYDAARSELQSGKVVAPVLLEAGGLRLRVIADRTTVEVFAQDGLVYLPLAHVARDGVRGVTLATERGACELLTLAGYELNSAWKEAQP